MIIRKIDSQGDWEFGKGLSSYAADEQAVDENIKTRILSWTNDCFFALQEGVDWRGRLDVGQQSALVDEIKSLILRSYGVVGINSIDAIFNGNTRNITVTYNIDTIFGSAFQAQLQNLIGVPN